MLSNGTLSYLYDESKVYELENQPELTGKDKNKLDNFKQNKSIYDTVIKTLQDNISDKVWMNPETFTPVLTKILDNALSDNIGKKDIEKLTKGLSKMDKKADIQKDKKGIIYDKDSKDTEIVKYQENIADYMAREVLPHLPDAKAFFEAEDENAIFEEDCGRKTIKIGAEIPFTRYFYKYQQPTPSEELKKKFLELENSVDSKIKKLFGAA